MGRVTKTSTRLVNNTDKVIHFYVESAGENYFSEKTLKQKEWFTEAFNPNCTYRKLRMFERVGNTTDDMLDSKEIAVTLRDGRFALHFTARSGETMSRAVGEGNVTWTQSFMNKLYWLEGPSYPTPK